MASKCFNPWTRAGIPTKRGLRAYNLFRALSHAIQTHFREHRPPYPVERTLLVTGILDAEMESRFRVGQPIDTPHLEFAYKPKDFRKMRELGATWKILHDGLPEPKGI